MREKLFDFILDHPLKVILVCLMLVGAVGWGAKYSQLNNDPRIFFSDDNPDYQAFTFMEDNFTSNEMVYFVITPEDGDVFTAKNLHSLEQLTELVWHVPNIVRVDSITNFQHTEVDGDFLEVDYLISDALDYDQERLDYVRNVAINEPSLLNRLISPSGHVAGIFATIQMSEGAIEAPAITAESRRIIAEFMAEHPHLKVQLTGTVIFSDASAMATEQGTTVTAPLALLAAVFCIIFMLRSIQNTLITLFLVVLSIVVAGGAMGWLGVELSPIVGMAPPMILTLGVADCIHMFMSFQRDRSQGVPRRDAMLDSLRINFQPIWLTSITTALGFLLLNFSSAQPFQALGNMVVVGVIAAFILAVAFVPALIMALPDWNYKMGSYSSRLMPWVGEQVIKHAKGLFFGVGFIVLILLAALPLNEINDVFNEYFDETFEVRRVNDYASAELTGLNRIDYTVESGSSGGAMEPEYIQHLNEFTEWAKQQHHVIYVSAFSDVVKRLNRDMNGGAESFYSVPSSRELIAQYTLMYELSLPYGLGLDNQVDLDKARTRVIISMHHSSTREVLAFNDAAETWMQENWPEAMHSRGTGMDILFGRITIRNIQSMLSGTAIALVLVSFSLIISLRSVRYGLLSLIPNLLPAGMAFGLWGLLIGEIGLAVSVVACMTLGIVVDDTVHFLSKYVRAKREQNLSTPDAVRYAFNTVGIALVGTSLILVANFGVMATSHFYPNSSMGGLSAITIAVALFVDFFFFVPLLLLMDRKKGSE